MKKPPAPTCATCIHVAKANNTQAGPATEGHCWRYPPTLIGPITSSVPPVKLDWRCGEWKKSA